MGLFSLISPWFADKLWRTVHICQSKNSPWVFGCENVAVVQVTSSSGDAFDEVNEKWPSLRLVSSRSRMGVGFTLHLMSSSHCGLLSYFPTSGFYQMRLVKTSWNLHGLFSPLLPASFIHHVLFFPQRGCANRISARPGVIWHAEPGLRVQVADGGGSTAGLSGVAGEPRPHNLISPPQRWPRRTEKHKQ